MRKRTRKTTAASSKGSKKPCVLPPSPHGPFWNGTTTDPEIIAVLVNNRDEAFHYEAETSRLDLVQDVWEFKIIPFFNVRELAVLRPTCRWCDEQWQEFLTRNVFRVPEQVPTIEEAMRVGFNLAKQKIYSKEKPLVIVLSEGTHGVEGSWTDSDGVVHENTLDITCSNITFVGQSKDKTTVRGGIGVLNKKNVTVKSLTVTNPNWDGLRVEGEEASVEMMDVCVADGKYTGLYVDSGASVKATQCELSKSNTKSGRYFSLFICKIVLYIWLFRPKTIKILKEKKKKKKKKKIQKKQKRTHQPLLLSTTALCIDGRPVEVVGE